MKELAGVFFKKDTKDFTRILFRYNPAGSKEYSASNECSSGFLDKILELKRDILRDPIVDKKFFHPDLENKSMHLKRVYKTERILLTESFSDYLGIMGCVFDIKNLESENNLHAPFSSTPHGRNYSDDTIYLYGRGRVKYVPYDTELLEVAARHSLFMHAKRSAKKVC